uniref:NADH-ubiquinone oxidoreductase chain 4 n=1 Tax=Leipothrix sp. 1 XFX-2017 TaxID=1955440 RepID=A0A1S5XVZ5_9ACAR|nr:NADH dehydrogenase subunit 4 [Leipothrix sp. 1 XFX-2017]
MWVFVFLITLLSTAEIFVCAYSTSDFFSPLVVMLVPMASLFMNRAHFIGLLTKGSAYFCLYLIGVCLVVCFMCTTPVFFLIFFEITVFPMTYLIINLSKDYDKIESAFTMLFLNLVGSIPFMYFISIMSQNNYNYFFFYHKILSNIIFASFFILLTFKFPIFLSHIWLTKAHVSGSGVCSIVLASVMLKLGTFGFGKFVDKFIFVHNMFLSAFCSFSLVGCFIFVLVMYRRMDAKYVVACSSVVHMATILPAYLSLSPLASFASMLMMVGHGFVSFVLFILVTAMYESSGTRLLTNNKSAESYNKTFSMISISYLFLNLGIPPFCTFLSEFGFLSVYFNVSTILFTLFFFMMFLSVLYTMFLISWTTFAKSSFLTSMKLSNMIFTWTILMLWGMGIFPYML